MLKRREPPLKSSWTKAYMKERATEKLTVMIEPSDFNI
jgi:ribosomal protein L24E